MIHRITLHGKSGDVVDVGYLCSSDCMSTLLEDEGVAEGFDTDHGTSGDIEWGAWPGGEEVDEKFWCERCGCVVLEPAK